MSRRVSLLALCALLGLVSVACGKADAPAAGEGALALPAAGPHRLMVLTPLWMAPSAQLYFIDGDEAKFLAMTDGGFMARPAFAPDGGEFYMSETFWSRGTRGERTDLITIFDAATLQPTGEIALPAGRFISGSRKHILNVTPDGRHLVSFNLTPASSVSLVDLEERETIAEIETPGCTLVFPFAPQRFAMLCTDGALLTHVFDDSGDVERIRSAKFFDPDQDPLIDQPDFVRADRWLYFVSYEGRIHPADLSGATPAFPEAWPAITPGDAGWRAGGTQPVAVNRKLGRLYVLVHRGERWTHKQAGEQVWVFDLATRRRIGRLALKFPADSIAVTRDAEAPQLYALSSDESVVSIYDAKTLRPLGELDEMGYGPTLLYVNGD